MKTEPYNANRLILVPAEATASVGNDMLEAPTRAYRDVSPGNSWVVMIWDNHRCAAAGTPWDGITKVSVRHTSAGTPQEFLSRDFSLPVGWDDLQAIKDRFWPRRIALEVYPPRLSIVNAADLRWLWVLPVSVVLPFNLEAGNPTLKGTQ